MFYQPVKSCDCEKHWAAIRVREKPFVRHQARTSIRNNSASTDPLIPCPERAERCQRCPDNFNYVVICGGG